MTIDSDILGNKKNILVCPLDWGLGHATRCIPIIHKLVESGANVIIGSDGRPYALLKKEFPDLQFIHFPGYKIQYPEKGSMVMKMLKASPRLLKTIKKERLLLQQIIAEHKIDIVISDNRYGLWNKNVKCVIITHQLSIICPKWLKAFEYVLLKLNQHYINKFDECWVPDFKGLLNLSGYLSGNFWRYKNVHFIGLLSRFNKPCYMDIESVPTNDVLFILSGPEPQRTVFENIILGQLKYHENIKAVVVRGITETDEVANMSENVKMVSHLETGELARAFSEAKMVICRPGYSSIMDIVTVGINAFFVPTPGQTEQEYLARYYHKKNLFYFTKQQNFDLLRAIKKSEFSKGVKMKNNQDDLEKRIHLLLS